MSVPTSRATFREYCLRRLGQPVIEINVDEDQVDDRIDEALKYFWDYHFDGSEKIFYKYEVTEQTLANKYVTMPDNVIGVVNLFPARASMGSNNLFDVRYQIALNDIYTLSNTSLIPYYMAMSHLSLLENLLVGQQPIRYNRHMNRLHIDMDWNSVSVGDFIVSEAYQIVDPDVFTKAWGDRWLQLYASCLIKQQWGVNISKFNNMKFPGGVTFNGDKIYNDATQERSDLEHEMIFSYSIPALDMIG